MKFFSGRDSPYLFLKLFFTFAKCSFSNIVAFRSIANFISSSKVFDFIFLILQLTVLLQIFLSIDCANAWGKMHIDALKDSIKLTILSGFRPHQKQYDIINNKLIKGITLQNILQENKLPGLSQHHSGNAIDIISNSYKLSVNFEKSAAYIWLSQHANEYGFYLQYPKDNRGNIMFEPWHWYYRK